MPDLFTNADALRTYLTGAASAGAYQPDDDLSLGGYRSAKRFVSTGVRRIQALGPIRVDFMSARNTGGKSGTLSLETADTLRFTGAPPFGGGQQSPGAAVQIMLGETKILETDNPINGRYVQVTRVSEESVTGSEIVQPYYHLYNALGGRRILDAESTAGLTIYRAVMLKNESALTLSGLEIFLPQTGNYIVDTNTAQLGASGSGTLQTSGTYRGKIPENGFLHIYTSGNVLREVVRYWQINDAGDTITIEAADRGVFGTGPAAGASDDYALLIGGIEIATELPVAGAIQTIASETTAPAALSWAHPSLEANALTPANLAPGAELGLWFKIFIQAGSRAGFWEQWIQAHHTYNAVQYRGRLAGKYHTERAIDDEYLVFNNTQADAKAIEIRPALGPSTAWHSFPTLPSSKTVTGLDTDHAHTLVVRRRSQYSRLLSQNHGVLKTVRLLSQAELAAKPSAPSQVMAVAEGSNKIRITAVYDRADFDLDEGARANRWAIYIAPNAAPDPSVVSPVIVTMPQLSGLETLSYLDESLDDGRTYFYLVRTQKDSAAQESTNLASQSASAIATGVLITPQGGRAFAGSFAALRPDPATPPSSPADDYEVQVGPPFIRFEPGPGVVCFYADSLLIWCCITDGGAGQNVLYIPTEWTINWRGGISGTGASTPFEVVSWNATKTMYICVDGKREALIDGTAMTMTFNARDAVDFFTKYSSATPVAQRANENLFQIWDIGIEFWISYMKIETGGLLSMAGTRLVHTLNQAAIEALIP